MITLLGIDGGGTKTRFVLTDAALTPIAVYDGPPGNLADIGEETLRGVLKDGAEAVLRSSGAPAPVSVFAGLAGSGGSGQTVCRILSDLFGEGTQTGAGTDAVNMLSCAHLDGDGALLIAGTGSGCFVRKDGAVTMVGGWGYLIDDGGSGFALGRDAFCAALRAADGRGGPTVLTELLSERLGYAVTAAIPEIYAKGKPFIASFAPCVFRAAEEGDGTAGQIVSENARLLAELLTAAGKRTGGSLSAAYGGGVLDHHPGYLEEVRRNVPAGIRLFPLPADPAFGAVFEAAKAAGIPADAQTRAAFTGGMNVLLSRS